MLISNIKKKDFKTQLIYFLFIVPALIVFIVFRAWPIMYSFILSFFDVNIISTIFVLLYAKNLQFMS